MSYLTIYGRKDLSARAKALYTLLLELIEDACPAVSFADLVRYNLGTDKTTRRALDQLENAGLIFREPSRSGGPMRYHTGACDSCPLPADGPVVLRESADAA